MDKNTKLIINGKQVFWGNQHKRHGFFRRAWNRFITKLINKVVIPVILFVRFFVKWTIILGGAALFVAGFAEGYRMYMAHDLIHHVEADEKIEVKIPKQLQAIADCESGIRLKSGKAVPNSASHYDKHGDVLERGNRDRSIDRGWAQINSVHNDEARRMGLDLDDEEDNKKFAVNLYKSEGTTPWNSSKSCWK